MCIGFPLKESYFIWKEHCCTTLHFSKLLLYIWVLIIMQIGPHAWMIKNKLGHIMFFLGSNHQTRFLRKQQSKKWWLVQTHNLNIEPLLMQWLNFFRLNHYSQNCFSILQLCQCYFVIIWVPTTWPKVQWTRTKHIDLYHYFILDPVPHHQLSLGYDPSHEQLIDILTKPLTSPQFDSLKIKFMVFSKPLIW